MQYTGLSTYVRAKIRINASLKVNKKMSIISRDFTYINDVYYDL